MAHGGWTVRKSARVAKSSPRLQLSNSLFCLVNSLKWRDCAFPRKSLKLRRPPRGAFCGGGSPGFAAARRGAAERQALNAAGGALLREMVRVLTPIQAISEESRPYSIFGQRFITTLRPLASASAAASSLRMPSCIQITCGPRLERQRLLARWQRVTRAAKNIDHVDRFRERRRAARRCDVRGSIPRADRIDRDHAVAAFEQVT